ncbi:hypothetical protein TNCV_4022901 [Trichonephila clavipes]|nr:hypothetical protein TNCV_4022901 [Trichonephila clavipes]
MEVHLAEESMVSDFPPEHSKCVPLTLARERICALNCPFQKEPFGEKEQMKKLLEESSAQEPEVFLLFV